MKIAQVALHMMMLCSLAGCQVLTGRSDLHLVEDPPTPPNELDAGPSPDTGAAGSGGVDSGPPAAGSGGREEPTSEGGASGVVGASGSAGGMPIVVPPPPPQPPSQPPAPPPMKNGELCTKNEECSSSKCDRNGKGESHCYGGVALNAGCSDDFDCTAASTCVKKTVGDSKGVCVDAQHQCDMKSECAFDVALSACQLGQYCADKPVDFNACVQQGCSITGFSDMTCDETKGIFDNLNANKCCPNAGFPGGECIVTTQCGCESSQKCDVTTASGFTTCGPAGTVAPYARCTRDSDCRAGYGCIGDVCERYCSGPDTTECGTGNACSSINSSGAAIPGAFSCTRLCDPVNPSSTASPFLGCGAGAGCWPTKDGFSDCTASTATGTSGAPCMNSNGESDSTLCAPGYVCGGSSGCVRFCHSSTDCATGTCTSFSTKLYASSVEIGYCNITN